MPKKITMSPEEHAALRARLEAMSDDDFTILVTPGPAAPDPARLLRNVIVRRFSSSCQQLENGHCGKIICIWFYILFG